MELSIILKKCSSRVIETEIVKKILLTCHGYTGYPEEMEPMGAYFEKHGWEWKNLTLPGHDSTPEALRKTTWKEWSTHAQYELDKVIDQYDIVVFSGLSLGGLMTLYMCATNPKLHSGIVLAAPLKILNWWQELVAKLFFIKFWLHRSEQEMRDINDPTFRYQHQAYDRHHTDSVRTLNSFVKEVNRVLPNIKQPLQLHYSNLDTLASPHFSEWIKEKSNASSLDIHIYDRSGHVLTKDYDREKIFQNALQFANNV